MIARPKRQPDDKGSGFFKGKNKKGQKLLVLDVDQTLVLEVTKEEMDSCPYIQQHPESIISIEIEEKARYYFMLPGVPEFIRDRVLKEDQLAFFSHASYTRNKLLIEEILNLALPEEKYNAVKATIPIFSEEHITNLQSEKYKNIAKRYQPQKTYYHGIFKKDLNVVTEHFFNQGKLFPLNQVILIDDLPTNVVNGQLNNYIEIPGFSLENVMNGEKKNSDGSFFRVNQIFYASGLLDAISHSKLEPTAALTHLQTKIRDSIHFEQGLLVLKNLNPRLAFMGEAPDSLQRTIQVEPLAHHKKHCAIL